MKSKDHLLACRPEPLGSYLKALGVLRLVSEQADSAATGCWATSGFLLRTELDETELSQFFLDDYRPTPVLSPWNSASGFGPEGRGELGDIEESTSPRLATYRLAIATARDILRQASEQPEMTDKQKKEWILVRCRSLLPDECIPWLDAAVVLTADGPAYPPLLGTGGNIGRFEVSRNFHNRLLEALGLHAKKEYDRHGWITDALWGRGQTPGRRYESPSQFDPGAAGGANSAPDGHADAVINPWDYVLLVEGAVLFAGGASRRLAVGAGGRAAAPFMADSTATGYASAAEGEASKGEIWTPLWGRPTGLAELSRLLAEGRADWRGSRARSGLDLAKAAGSLGIDRGVSAFVRHVFLERAGQATIVVPAGRIKVELRPTVAPLADLDPWLERVRRGANPPTAVDVARRRLERAEFDVAVTGRAEGLLQVLVEAARLEAAVGRASGFRERANLAPIRGLRASRWFPALAAGQSTVELRLALSLASARDLDDSRRHPTSSLRSLLRPVKYGHGGRPEWSEVTPVEGFGNRPITEVLADAHARRVVELLGARRASGTSTDQVGLPTRFQAGLWAGLADVSALAEGQVDEDLLSDLLAGCLLLDWGPVDSGLGAERPPGVPAALSILGPFYADQPREATEMATVNWDDMLRSVVLRPETIWPALLAADRVEPVLTAALRRMRIAGIDPVAVDGHRVASGLRRGDGPRLGASLLCRLSPNSRVAMLRQACPDPDLSHKEDSNVQS